MGTNTSNSQEAESKWAIQGPYVEEYDPEFRLLPREGLEAEPLVFDRLLTSMLNVAFENGYVHKENVAQVGRLLRESHDLWYASRAAGSTWADTLFPDRGDPQTLKPSFSRQLLFHAKGDLLLLSQVGTGAIFAQIGPDDRSITGFFEESTVQIELVVDLVTIVFAAMGMPARSSVITNKFARYLVLHPRIRTLFSRFLDALIHRRDRTFTELAKDIAEIFETLWRIGFFVEVGNDLVEGWDWFDWLVFILGIVAMLTPAGGATTGAKVAYMAIQVAAMSAEIMQKWVRYRDGEPLDQGPLGN